jgi:hypothetical protein
MTKRRFPKATKRAVRRAQARPQTRRTRKRVPTKRPPERAGSKQASSRRPKRRVLDAVAKMRKGKSLTRAARSAHTTRTTVRKYASKVLKPIESGRYRVKASDSLSRELRFLSRDGIVIAKVRSSREASEIASYWNAVDHYLRTGSIERLADYRGSTVRVGRKRMPFITDPATLERLAHAGEVRFEDLYPNTN